MVSYTTRLPFTRYKKNQCPSLSIFLWRFNPFTYYFLVHCWLFLLKIWYNYTPEGFIVLQRCLKKLNSIGSPWHERFFYGNVQKSLKHYRSPLDTVNKFKLLNRSRLIKQHSWLENMTLIKNNQTISAAEALSSGISSDKDSRVRFYGTEALTNLCNRNP